MQRYILCQSIVSFFIASVSHMYPVSIQLRNMSLGKKMYMTQFAWYKDDALTLPLPLWKKKKTNCVNHYSVQSTVKKQPKALNQEYLSSVIKCFSFFLFFLTPEPAPNDLLGPKCMFYTSSCIVTAEKKNTGNSLETHITMDFVICCLREITGIYSSHPGTVYRIGLWPPLGVHGMFTLEST